MEDGIADGKFAIEVCSKILLGACKINKNVSARKKVKKRSHFFKKIIIIFKIENKIF